MHVRIVVAVIALAAGLAACSSQGNPVSTHPITHSPSASSAVNLTGIPVPTKGSDGIWHFKFPASADVTGNLCGKDTPQLDQRLKDMGVVKGTAGMIALDGGNNAPGTMTICALGY